VEGTDNEWDRATYREAGALLARLHTQLTVVDDGEFARRQKADTLAWLTRPHRIDPQAVAVLADEVERWPTPLSVVVPTHGDWQPRNWLAHGGRLAIIDFGRADLRPAYTDLGRLAAQQFLEQPELEPAFLDGYGSDPRESASWMRLRIREAIGTAAWAFKVGDERYEQQGHQMIAAVVEDLGRG